MFEKKDNLVQTSLSYDLDALDPVFSEENMSYHYKILARRYVDRYNNKEGDQQFNEAGAVLHNLFFSQFRPPSRTRPMELMQAFIERNFKTYENMLAEVEKEAMALQGSGWVYIAKDGSIKTIENHAVKKDILILIDVWEHSYYIDYGPDKKRYLKNIWRIIDWDKIEVKLT